MQAAGGRDEHILHKITKAFVLNPSFYLWSVFFYFTTARGFIFVGEAIKTSHIGVFPPRLIYLQGNLLSGHKTPSRKIPIKFIPCASPITSQLGAAGCRWSGNKSSFFQLSHIHLNSKRPHLNQEFVFSKCQFI